MLTTLRRSKRQAVTLDARLSFTGSGDVLLHVPGDPLILGATRTPTRRTARRLTVSLRS